MIVMYGVAKFVQKDIVDEMLRERHEEDREIDAVCCRARTPSCVRCLNPDLTELEAKLFSQLPGPPFQDDLCLLLQLFQNCLV